MSKAFETIKNSLKTQSFTGFQNPPGYSPLPVEEDNVKLKQSNDPENGVFRVQVDSYMDSLDGGSGHIHEGIGIVNNFWTSLGFTPPNPVDTSQITYNRTTSSKPRLTYPIFIIILLITYLTLTLIGISVSHSATLHLLVIITFLSIGIFLFVNRILRYLSPETFECESVLPSLRLHFQFILFLYLMTSVSVMFLLGGLVYSGELIVVIIILAAIGGLGALIGIAVIHKAAKKEEKGKSGRMCGF